MYKWYTYILHSPKIDKYYVGSTDNLSWRLERHNMGWGKYTKRGMPWELVYYEVHEDKSNALSREKEIKKMKSRKYIEHLISRSGGRPD
ncbi:MAG: GIY-YIG nuclease family protein [Ignavibacteriales bacterium]|nr:GIY-YIG nuclease family protein [Ignavibacteriales bacterium]